KIMPALVCGNTIVFKPSSATPLCAAELVKIIEQAGLPKGVLNFITGSAEEVGKPMVRHKALRAISFTGHRDTGEWILKNAGIKRIGLELGGKNGIIVMDDADLDLAADGIIWAGYGTAGQRCTAASRVIALDSVYAKLQRKLVARIGMLRLGNGLERKTDIGPLVSQAAVEKAASYVDIGQEEGASLLVGGGRLKGRGFFYQPTLFGEVQQGMRIAQEEIFGPVVGLLRAGNFDAAIDIMNSVKYGLSASIYTKDVRNAFLAIQHMEAGITYVNASTIGAEVHLPFGGVKETGNGAREGSSGIEEFSEVKTVYVDYSGKLQRAQIDVD
ncbi:MAG: aldehyde dehydrogenase family protein, partial [Candidatus Aenigmarchaeota archaeon]|nr:aldehyde dehydrogenase family protein [Candidatus Aenigmarchaeota archaeon]